MQSAARSSTGSVRSRPVVATMTDAARDRVLELTVGAGRPDAMLKIGIRNGGCAGMSYTMALVDEASAFDERIERDGATVLIDAGAILFLLGTRIDYEATELRSGFVFRNPNETSACGCGESVSLVAAPADERMADAPASQV